MYEAPPTSAAVDAAFALIVGAVALITPISVRAATLRAGGSPDTARRRAWLTAVALGAWALTWVALASAGVLSRFDLRPPPFMFMPPLLIGATVAVARSTPGRDVARHLPIAALVGIQGFRLPLELVLHRLSVEGALPPQMTFVGFNFDIITGVLALALAAWALRRPLPTWALLGFNLIGSALLLTIVTIAVLSAPIPIRQFWSEPANTLVASPTYVLLPFILVLAAFIGHTLIFMRLRWQFTTNQAHQTMHNQPARRV